MKLLISMLFFSFTLSCGEKDLKTEKKSSDNEGSTGKVSEFKDSGYKSQKTDNIKTDLKWDFEVLREGEYGEPVTRLSLYVNGKKYVIKDEVRLGFFELPLEELKSLGLEGAISGCRGWWAGAGEEYWVTKSLENKELSVYMRELNEVSDETDEKGSPKPYIGQPMLAKIIPLSD